MNETNDLNIEIEDLTQVEYEEEVKFSVTPIKGYKVKSIKIIDSEDNEIEFTKTTEKNEYHFIMPASDVAIIPSYERVSNSVDVEDNIGTKEIKIEVNSVSTVVYDDKVKFTIIPEEGYELDKIEITDEDNNKINYRKTDKDNEYEFTMPDKSVKIKPIYRKIEKLVNPKTGNNIFIVLLLIISLISISYYKIKN